MNDILLMNTGSIVSLRKHVSEDFYNSRKELETYSLSLDKDASSKSPSVLYKKLYQAREYTNRSGVIYSRFLKMNVLAKKLLLQRTEERRVEIVKIFQFHADELAKFRSSDEKNKYCESFLSEDSEKAFINAKLLKEETDGYVQYFRLQFDFYREIKQDILTQLGIIRSMIMLGELPLVNDFGGAQQDIELDKGNPDQVIGEGVIQL